MNPARSLTHGGTDPIQVRPGRAPNLGLGFRVLVLLDVLEDRAGVVRLRRRADAARPVGVVPRDADRHVRHRQLNGAPRQHGHAVLVANRRLRVRRRDEEDIAGRCWLAGQATRMSLGGETRQSSRWHRLGR